MNVPEGTSPLAATPGQPWPDDARHRQALRRSLNTDEGVPVSQVADMDVVPPEMAQALADSLTDVLPIEGVNGYDIGLDSSGELAMRILVGDPENPPGGLPDTVGGFPVVLVHGEPVIEQGVLPDRAPHEPAFGGVQIGTTVSGGLTSVGTLGCVFRDPNGEPVGISNAHVICDAPGGIIRQPAPTTDPPPDSERVGRLIRCEAPGTPAFFPVPGLGGISGVFDAAVFSIGFGRTAKVGEIAGIGQATGISSPRLGDIVRKRGFRTRLTHGVVSGTLGNYRVADPNGNMLWWMLGQVSIALIPDLGLNPDGVWSRNGDSGSAVVNQANEIVALHFGGDGTSGYATDFATLAFAFGLTL